MKGYFGIGVEGVSKAMNVGALFRTAHAFGASFIFTVAAAYRRGELGNADTSDTPGHVPTWHFDDLKTLALPLGCRLVGIEITPDAIELPSFRHPRQAAYVLGSEREGLSRELQGLCDHIVRIPTRFSVNLGIAGALVMYDRTLSLGRFAERPVAAGGPREALPVPAFGEPLYKKRARQRAARARLLSRHGTATTD
jgi:tRNA G18 (ribose-2'-O)-methylase SpoU